MKSFDTELHKHAQKLKLRAAERRELRERVLSYMEYHPLPKRQEVVAEERIESQHFVTIPFNTRYTRILFGAVAVLLFVVVPVAAERSVPGDVLYLVKTHVNESIQGQFANSPYEKVAFETKLMERRISEARLLAREGRLTSEVEAQIADTVKGHADAAQSGIEELRVDDAEEAAIAEISFGSALEVQSAVLDTEEGTEESNSVASIKNAVKNAQDAVDESREGTMPSYERLMGRIEFETTRAYELFEAVREPATEAERADIERRLEDIARKIEKAQTLHDEDQGAATAELAKTLGMIQKLIVFMTDIDVRENVTLEALVPVELTDKERTETAHIVLDELLRIQEAVSDALETVEDEAVSEKVSQGLSELRELIGRATTSLEAGETASLEVALTEAAALAQDLENLVGGQEEQQQEESSEEEQTEETASSTEEGVSSEVLGDETGTSSESGVDASQTQGTTTESGETGTDDTDGKATSTDNTEKEEA